MSQIQLQCRTVLQWMDLTGEFIDPVCNCQSSGSSVGLIVIELIWSTPYPVVFGPHCVSVFHR